MNTPDPAGVSGPFDAEFLRTLLQARLPDAVRRLLIAISGGADSACLLTALATGSVRKLPVRAVHVDHGLQPAAADLRRACEQLCSRLRVPLTIVEVTVDAPPGHSLEEAARDARYRGIARLMEIGDCLLTAHHAEDQAETVLLQLLRGAGIKGLSAMPWCRPWSGGWHVRPLLGIGRRDLRRFGEEQGVRFENDPMNLDVRFDRAYVRERLWPSIEERWPGAAATLSRSAQHVADAQEVLDRAAGGAVRRLRDGVTLSVPGLRALSASERRNALRFWIAGQGVPPPSAARLGEALRQIMGADEDHLPAVVWGSHALRRYRDRLFLTAAEPPRVAGQEWSRTPGTSLDLGVGLGRLRWCAQRGGLNPARLPERLAVRRRVGGERFRPQRSGRTQTLQHLCQSWGVLPWMRDALPLVYAGDALVAVGDLWTDAAWCVAAGAAGIGCEWDEAPILV